MLSSQEYKLLNPLLSQSMKLQDNALAEELDDDNSEHEEDEVDFDGPFSNHHKPMTITLLKGDVGRSLEPNNK